jgi:hypothetical protein
MIVNSCLMYGSMGWIGGTIHVQQQVDKRGFVLEQGVLEQPSSDCIFVNILHCYSVSYFQKHIQHWRLILDPLADSA